MAYTVGDVNKEAMNEGMNEVEQQAFGYVSNSGQNVDLFGDEEVQIIVSAIIATTRERDQNAGDMAHSERDLGGYGAKGSQGKQFAQDLLQYEWSNELIDLSQKLRGEYEEGRMTEAETRQIESLFLLDQLVKKVKESGQSLDDISVLPQFHDQHMEEGMVHYLEEFLRRDKTPGREGKRTINIQELINVIMGGSMNRRVGGTERKLGGKPAVDKKLVSNMAIFLDKNDIGQYLPPEVRQQYGVGVRNGAQEAMYRRENPRLNQDRFR